MTRPKLRLLKFPPRATSAAAVPPELMYLMDLLASHRPRALEMLHRLARAFAEPLLRTDMEGGA